MAYLVKYMSRGSRFAAHYYRGYSSMTSPYVMSEEVRLAKSEGKPIVALESTIITHGMPYPQNLETALQVEHIIRERGATPATIAILKGQLTVGLSEDQLQYLAKAKGVVKASRRDLAPIAAAKMDGATTVAGTIIAAELADIPVFVTGGIGGVHRKGENTLDISADLNELGRSNTLVVCSGVKSILDIGRTLEYLETQGVCVCTFGESTQFPAFYTRQSGYRSPHNVANAQHAARLLHAAKTMRLNSGTVIAVPIPEEYAMDEKVIEEAICRALKDAETKGIAGKEVTPFILSAVSAATGGASLDANIALIKNNAKVGADIAVEFKKLWNVHNPDGSFNIGVKSGGISSSNSSRHFHTSCSKRGSGEDLGEDETPLFGAQMNRDGDVLVIGGANVDRTYKFTEGQAQLDGSTHPCTTAQSGGGVGRNMAEALWRLRGGRTRLLTAVADDADGQYLADIAPGLLLDGCIIKSGRTASYASVMDARGECLLGLGDMALHNHITADLIDQHIDVLEQAPLVVIDGNVPQGTIDHTLTLCHRLQKPVFFEPTDRRKATRPFQSKLNKLTYASPNLLELRAMSHFVDPTRCSKIEACSQAEIIDLCTILSKYINFIVVTMGAQGVLTVKGEKVRLYSVNLVDKIENVSGAGDCFASGFIHGIISGYKESQCIFLGLETAKKALLCHHTVPYDLNSKVLLLKDAEFKFIS